MTANAEAIEAWNTVLFDKFARFRRTVTAGFLPQGRRTMERLGSIAGARVVDLGCGFGDTTIELAARVGPSGRVVGIDAAERFIAIARTDARGIANATFHVADVERELPGGPYDAAFSRFGMMFFASPVIALRRVHAALVPGGKLAMVVWRNKEANEWLVGPERAARAVLGDPDKGNHVTCGPGPFSMASPDVVGDQLVAAGFTDIAFERSDTDVELGADLDDALELVLALGPAGEVIRLAGDIGVARRAEIEDAVRKQLAQRIDHDRVRSSCSAWIVTARTR
jgi:SAM-dependent methyltransferase